MSKPVYNIYCPANAHEENITGTTLCVAKMSHIVDYG